MFLNKVEQALQEATHTPLGISEELLKKFGDRCRNSVAKQFNEEHDNNVLRLSQISRPLCQLQMITKGEQAEPLPAKFKMTVVQGDMLEALVLLLLEHIYGDSVKCDVPVEYAGIKGTADLVLNGSVWDVKTASPWSYNNKFASYESLKKDDSFGYIGQLFGYAAGLGIPAGGFIVINKSSGEIKSLNVNHADQDKYLRQIRENKNNLSMPFRRVFSPEQETWYRKPTGKMILPMACQFCRYKHPCWGDKISYEVNENSKTGVRNWYVK